MHNWSCTLLMRLRHVAGGATVVVGGGVYRLAALEKRTHAWGWVKVSTGRMLYYGISCCSRQAKSCAE